MQKIINKRIALEKKYTNLCIYYGYPLKNIKGKLFAMSPTNYFSVTRHNPMKGDFNFYNELSSQAHFGTRGKIEEEVLGILNADIHMFCNYFYQLRALLINKNHDELNKLLLKKGLPSLKKDKYNRLMKLLRKWQQESEKCHYKVTGAKRRISEKNLKRMGGKKYGKKIS